MKALFFLGYSLMYAKAVDKLKKIIKMDLNLKLLYFYGIEIPYYDNLITSILSRETTFQRQGYPAIWCTSNRQIYPG